MVWPLTWSVVASAEIRPGFPPAKSIYNFGLTSLTTCLSPMAAAFYNPCNTALEAVVSLIRHPGTTFHQNGWTFRQRVRESQSRFLQFPGALHEEVSLGIG